MTDQRDDDGVNNRNRNHLANAELADSGILLCEVRDGKAARPHVDDAVEAILRAQRKNKARQLEFYDAYAVHQANQQADRKRQQNRHRNAASGFKRLAADNAADAGCSTQRQVDAAGAEQESHRHGNHDPEGCRAENIHQIVEAKEVFIDKAHDDHQDDQRNSCARFFLR